MKNRKKTQPPAWAKRFLHWYCRPEIAEDLEGDLNEYFERNVKLKGVKHAQLIYIIDVFKFLRGYTIRKPKFVNLFIQWIMIGSYIKTSGRSIVRNKLFSTINIFGLAISMSVGLLMISFVVDLTSYDDFFENKERIYRVTTENKFLDHQERNFASSSLKAGKLIRENVPGLQSVALVGNGFGGDAKVGENVVPIDGKWADENFFEVFSFTLLKGNRATALKEPYSLVITEKTAKKIFGEEDAFGKSVKVDTTHYIVTAVMKDIPKFSHIQFEALASFASEEIRDPKLYDNWEHIWSNYAYILVDEKTQLATIQATFDKISTQENALIQHTVNNLTLQPLKDIVLGKDYNNEHGPTMTISVIWIISGLSFVVILSACFNYTNLSIARSLRRSREVGIRKVIGALKAHVLGQFLAEAIIIALLALTFSLLLFILIRPQFLTISPEMSKMVSLDLSVKVVALFLVFALVVGILAGLLPALFFSRINAVQVLKDISSIKVFRHLNVRKALIVVQYTISLAFITATIIGFKQYRSFLTFDLGFSTENVLNIRLQGNNAQALTKVFSEILEVSDISRSMMVTSVGNYYGTQLKYNNGKDSLNLWFNSIDEKYLPLHGHRLIAGRNFTETKASDKEESEVIINEQLVARLDPKNRDPEKAIGQIIEVDGRDVTIIGVLKDFHYGKVDSKIEPLAFRNGLKETSGFLNVKVSSQDLMATMASIEKAWKKIDPVHSIDATFYDDDIERAYTEFSAMLKIIGFLAFLAICIASLGLLGMVVFITETRLKEISIRKVLGASEGSLIYLLSRGFVMLLAISALIALPSTYLFFSQVVLVNFPYSSPISMSELFSGLLGVLALASVMIGAQTFKIARSNPATVLKGE